MTSAPLDHQGAQQGRRGRSRRADDSALASTGCRVIDEYLLLVAAEYGGNAAREMASHLATFFTELAKEPNEVTTADVLGFLRRQTAASSGNAREAQLAERRLSCVTNFFVYLESGRINTPLDGVPPGLRGRPRSLLENSVLSFWAKVERAAGDDGCWEWKGSRDARGYGIVRLDGQLQKAHRVAWMLVNGQRPPLRLRHSCGNAACVRPEHLAKGKGRAHLLAPELVVRQPDC